MRLHRYALLALVMTSTGALADDDDDVDRTDFSDPALSEDKDALGPQGPHSDIEPAWILPDCPDGRVPIGGTTDMVVALANGGAKMFNVSAIEASLLTPSGKLVAKLDRYEYGHSLGPREQRSFRYPLPISAEMPLGEYLLVASAYYNTRDKEPFVSVVCNETTELVPPLPDKEAQARLVQIVVGGGAALMALLMVIRLLFGSSSKGDKKKAGATPAAAKANGKPGDEWLAGTLAGSEDKASKKKKYR